MSWPRVICLLLPYLWFSGFSVVHADPVAADGPNVALKKPVYGKADWPQDLVDGDEETSISPHAGRFPVVAVDLVDVYNLRSIHIHAQNEEVYERIGLDTPFSVYTWDTPFSPCDLELHYPWRVLQKNLVFKKPGDKVVLNGPVKARYIIILPDITDPFTEQKWLPLGEVKAFGDKVEDAFNPASMKDGVEVPDVYTETRNQLLKGASKMLVQMSFAEYRMNSKYADVPVTWHVDRITTMAVRRQKARLIFMSGVKSVRLLQNDSDYAQLRDNFRAWLNPDNPKAKLVSVSEKFNDGDILIITRLDQFDVEAVYKRLIEGKNSAIVAYLGEKQPKKNRVMRLMKKLEVIVETSTINYGNEEHKLEEFLKWSDKGFPDDFEFQAALKSWKQFRTQRLNFHRLRNDRRREKWFQEKVREVLKKYRDYYTMYAPCPERPQTFSAQDLNGVTNYNNLLLLQEGSDVVPAPGACSAPGTILPSVKPTNMTIRFKADAHSYFYPTGAYAKPGVPFRYKVLHTAKVPVYQYHIVINPQQDKLTNQRTLKRWPIVTKNEPLEMEGESNSPFGGPIMLVLGGNAEVTIRLENVYRYPWLDLRDPESVKNWESERSSRKGVPYGIIAGDKMLSMLDEKTLASMDKDSVVWATQYYDNMIKTMHNYRGSHFEQARQEFLVSDIQLTEGAAHSGYPWMALKSVAQHHGDLEYIKKGQNVHYAEMLGHNLAVEGMKCKNGGTIIGTVYIAVVHKYLLGLDSYNRSSSNPGCTPADEARMLQIWKGGKYEGMDLGYYNYMGRLFGPGLLGNVIPHLLNRSYCPYMDEETTNLWVKHMCRESGYDLVPLHRLWHFKIQPATLKTCEPYPCAFPDDELTKQASELVDKLIKDHKKECKRTGFKEVQFKINPMTGTNTTQPQMIFISN